MLYKLQKAMPTGLICIIQQLKLFGFKLEKKVSSSTDQHHDGAIFSRKQEERMKIAIFWRFVETIPTWNFFFCSRVSINKKQKIKITIFLILAIKSSSKFNKQDIFMQKYLSDFKNRDQNDTLLSQKRSIRRTKKRRKINCFFHFVKSVIPHVGKQISDRANLLFPAPFFPHLNNVYKVIFHTCQRVIEVGYLRRFTCRRPSLFLQLRS